MSARIPPYLIAAPLDRRARQRRRLARRAARVARFPFLLLVALLRWLASPCFF